jgi:hypothetical protein
MKKPTLSSFNLGLPGLPGLPIALSLAFGVVACGGSDDSGGKSNSGGTSAMSDAGTSSSSGGTSSSTAGSTNHAGSMSSGGSGTSSGGDLDTGLPDDKTISSLTDAEIVDLCSKIDAFYSEGKVADSLEDFSCRFAGMFAAAFSAPETDAAARAACQAAYDECAAAPAEGMAEKCTKPTGVCTATVGEVEACANDSAKALDQLVDTFPSCAELTLADLMSMDGGDPMTPADPASCTTVEMKCPDAPMPPSGM